MIDVVVVLLIIFGFFGPLLFISSWVDAISEWIGKDHPSIAGWVGEARHRHLGRLMRG